jgi:hypothetical protein
VQVDRARRVGIAPLDRQVDHPPLGLHPADQRAPVGQLLAVGEKAEAHRHQPQARDGQRQRGAERRPGRRLRVECEQQEREGENGEPRVERGGAEGVLGHEEVQGEDAQERRQARQRAGEAAAAGERQEQEGDAGQHRGDPDRLPDQPGRELCQPVPAVVEDRRHLGRLGPGAVE